MLSNPSPGSATPGRFTNSASSSRPQAGRSTGDAGWPAADCWCGDHMANEVDDFSPGEAQFVDITPTGAASRRSIACRGIAVELVQAGTHERLDFCFRTSRHLLVAYEQGTRLNGETCISDTIRSNRRELGRKLTFIPAGHEYREWHEPRTQISVLFIYLDPSEYRAAWTCKFASALLPRLFFDDPALWSTVSKLRQVLQSAATESPAYVQALGLVLTLELAGCHRRTDSSEPHVRGGLAAWQQRVVTAYIDEHLADRIPLAILARLARLSPYHFCRAFKKSFGVPPRRYHTNRRIERAKVLLERRPLSVTDVGLSLGFSETSSFTAAFRRATGLTPSGYHRSL